MRILVVGSGGREHALAWKLAQEAEVLCAPGNPGIAEDVECLDIKATEHERLALVCRQREIDLVVVGPEDPLIEGLADRLREEGINVYGPEARAARLEGSKAFSKALMRRGGVLTAEFESFTEAELAREYARGFYDRGAAVAVKASGNALGKGVVVAETFEEASEAIDRMMVHREFGDAADTIVIEQRLNGREFSLLTIVGDENFVSLPVAQDHKRAFDGDLGPNTGGMGTYSPCEWVSDSLIREANEQVVAPILQTLRAAGMSYRGTLFSGILVDSGRPYCLEYNVRFGDPETQSVMMRLGSGFAQALYDAAIGVDVMAPEVLTNAAVTVVVASGGYPGSYEKGRPISLPSVPEEGKIFHAGTALIDGALVTNGGRVFGCSAAAPTMAEARAAAYSLAADVRFEGAFYRSDIG